MAEDNEISRHEVEVAAALIGATAWLTNVELSDRLPTVRPRTVRAKTAKFVQLGLVDVAEVFPGHRFKWSGMARQRNTGYLLRLSKAAEVLGMPLTLAS